MGGDKGGGGTTITQSGSSTQERQPTKEETRLNELDVQLRESTQPYLIPMQQQGLQLGSLLLQGRNNLPGFMNNLPQGISPEVTQGIVDQSLRDVDTRMAGQGLMDSGTRASVLSRTSGDIRRAAEEFNIGNRLNLLNLALTGQAQVQQPVLGFSSNLGQRLTTLGPTTKTYNNTSTQGRNSMGGFSMGF